MHQVIQELLAKAKSNSKTIVLADGIDPRVQEAALIINRDRIANLIVIGTNIQIDGIQTLDPANNKYSEVFAQKLYEIRKAKGLSLEDATNLIKSPLYLGTMLVNEGVADGMVAGSNCPTADVLRPALQIIKTSPGHRLVSSFFMIFTQTNTGDNGLLFFADCSLNIRPNSEELADIAIQTADSFKKFTNKEPKLALLSFSTNGSGKDDSIELIKNAANIAKSQRPDLIIEGEIQADAALVPHISLMKNPNSQLQGEANVLIFPDINTGNIGYKLVQRLGNAKAFGPITQGLNKPINDLSRGCSVEDIVITTAITSVQSASPVSS